MRIGDPTRNYFSKVRCRYILLTIVLVIVVALYVTMNLKKLWSLHWKSSFLRSSTVSIPQLERERTTFEDGAYSA